jgi:hypothetical protein
MNCSTIGHAVFRISMLATIRPEDRHEESKQ